MTSAFGSTCRMLLGAFAILALAVAPAIAIVACGNSSNSGGSGGDVTGLGDLPGGGFESRALAVSADGSAVVGQSNSAMGTEAFRWTSGEGMTGLGDLPLGLFRSQAFDVSDDGSVAVGTSNAMSDFEAFRFTAAGGIAGLGDLPGGDINGVAYAVSADGSAAAGRSDTDAGFQAFRWDVGLDTMAHTPDDVMEGLGDLAGGRFSSRASGMSADGSVIVGRGTSAPFVHGAANDPITEGWATTGTGTGVLEGQSAAGALGAWFIDDNSSTMGTDSTLGYVLVPSVEQISDTDMFGWKLATRLRVTDLSDVADFSVAVEYATGTRRYSLAFGTNALGRPIVVTWDGVSGAASPPSGPSFTVPGTPSTYHLYELRFDPETGTADLFIDGVERISNYAGHTFEAGATGRRVVWGSLSDAATGHAEYNFVSWGSVDDTARSRSEAFRWDAGVDSIAHTLDDVLHGIGDLAGGEFSSEAFAVSADGLVIVGKGTADEGDEAFRWENTGTCALDNAGPAPCMVGLGDLPGGSFNSVATAASGDGSVVVGFGSSAAGTEAFIWDAISGMRKLSDALMDAALDPGDWTLSKAHDISDDGTVIVGEGINPDGDPEAWMVVLP